MRVLLAIVFIFLANTSLKAQFSYDWDVEGPDYRGCIVEERYSYDSDRIIIIPTKAEAIEAELSFRIYLKKYMENVCTHPGYEIDSVDCLVLKSEFSKYVNEYTGHISRKDGHRYIEILCLSKTAQDLRKNDPDLTIMDGGPVYFHVLYDLTLHKVIHFHDNGWG